MEKESKVLKHRTILIISKAILIELSSDAELKNFLRESQFSRTERMVLIKESHLVGQYLSITFGFWPFSLCICLNLAFFDWECANSLLIERSISFKFWGNFKRDFSKARSAEWAGSLRLIIAAWVASLSLAASPFYSPLKQAALSWAKPIKFFEIFSFWNSSLFKI